MDGYPRLRATYGLQFKQVTTVDLGLIYRVLVNHQADLVAGNSTDGQIRLLGLISLADDRRAFPPYEAAIVARDETLRRHPMLEHALGQLGGRIQTDVMMRLNEAVDGLHKSPTAAVRNIISIPQTR